MENHSYDNLLGFMENPIGELTGNEYNALFPKLPFLKKYYVKKGASFSTYPDPPHGFSAVNR